MAPPLPGSIGISKLSVYDTTAPDGLPGGTPHMHLTCSEGYVVVAGSGQVQTLSGQGYRETPLTTGTVAWFAPGTIHRLVNDGGLQIIVLMQNSGLPEAGDAVLTFPPAVLADEDAYREASTLTPGLIDSAFRRRNLAVTGFLALRESGGFDEFCRAAARIVAPKLDDWHKRWEAGALETALETGRQLDALRKGDVTHLAAGDINVLDRPTDHAKHGMCGLLDTYLP